MEYKKYGDAFFIRMDKNDEIVSCILDLCKKERIKSATFCGIGGCSEAQIQTFVPEEKTFETRTICGMLELVSLNGNVVSDENDVLYHHTHAMLSYIDGEKHCLTGGHIKSINVLYTAEVELRPLIGGNILREYDPETGTGFWKFS